MLRIITSVAIKNRMIRQLLVRASRFVGNLARLDLPNSMYTNGELNLQAFVLAHSANQHPVICFDVGANEGEWSSNFLEAARKTTNSVRLYCFEPSSFTFSKLKQNLSKYGEEVKLENSALSNHSGSENLFIAGDGLGINSLHKNTLLTGIQGVETISVNTLDDFCSARNITEISLLKIDAEGHDLKILEGSKKMIANGKIQVIQFEYNWRWIDGRCYLKDVFDLVEGTSYRIGKLTPFGAEFYPKWHPELETFKEGNYLLVKGECLEGFPKVKWWRQ